MSRTQLCALLFCLAAAPAFAQTPKDFNACTIVTVEEATAALGAQAEGEPVNPKAKQPKLVPNCTYSAAVDGQSQLVKVQFRFYKSPAEAVATLKETRLDVRGRPLIIQGQDAYWDNKQTQLVIAKGSAILTLIVGPAKDNERQPEAARKLAEKVLPKLD